MKFKSTICKTTQAGRLKRKVHTQSCSQTATLREAQTKQVLPICKTVAIQHKRIQTTRAESTTQKEHAKSKVLIESNGMLVGVGEP